MAVGASLVLSGCVSTGASDARKPGPASSGGADQAVPGVRPAPASPKASAPARRRPDREQLVPSFGGRTPRVWGLEPPGVTLMLPPETSAVALTFDCCGGPGGSGFDRSLLSALKANKVPATFFLNTRWVRSNLSLTRELAADPLFEIANHGTGHRPLSVTGESAYGIAGTADAGQVYDEIMGAQAELSAATGRTPRFFRSGTAHYDDVAVQICRTLGLVPVNFTVNGDAGATYPAAAVAAELLSAGQGSIIIAHANRPDAGTGTGVKAALPRMKDRGTRFIRLSDAPPA
jgi:peptidoglycan/xylan/chitin deacetylase (PgdA/CDA1 family)